MWLPNLVSMSTRQPSAAASASRGSHGSSSAVMTKFLELKKEYDAVSALEQASALYLQRVEALAQDCEIMAEAGQGNLIHPDCCCLPHPYHSSRPGPRTVATDVPDSELVL